MYAQRKAYTQKKKLGKILSLHLSMILSKEKGLQQPKIITKAINNKQMNKRTTGKVRESDFQRYHIIRYKNSVFNKNNKKITKHKKNNMYGTFREN